MVSEDYVHPGFVIFQADVDVGSRHYPLPVPTNYAIRVYWRRRRQPWLAC